MRILSVLLIGLTLCGCANQAQNLQPQPTQLSGYWASVTSLYEEHWFIQPDGTGESCSLGLKGVSQLTTDKLRIAGDQIANGGATYTATQVTADSFNAQQNNGPSHFSFSREAQATGACGGLLPMTRKTRVPGQR